MDRITLPSGRVVGVSDLMQYKTYAGLLCGLPDKDMTVRRVTDLLEKGKTMGLGSPWFIQPVTRRREAPRNGEMRIEERLPPVACLARFDSGEIPGSGDPYSEIVVAWFQQRFGDMNQEIVDQVTAIDWERCALPWCP